MTASLPNNSLSYRGNVQLLADLVRHLECVGPPALLDCLLSLRFPDVVVPISSSGKGETEQAKAEQERRLKPVAPAL